MNKMELKDWISVFALLLSFGSFAIAILSFRRNRRIDSENLLFKYKADGYTQLIEQLTTIMDKILDQREVLSTIDISELSARREELNNAAKEIDLVIGSFVNDLIKQSLFFSKRVKNELDSFSGFLYQDDVVETKESLDEFRQALESHYNDFIEKADLLHDLMREDLHVDRLNEALSKRLR